MAMLGAIVALERGMTAGPTDLRALADLLGEFTDRIVAFGDAEGACAQARVALVPASGELGAIAAAVRRAGDGHAIVLSADLAHPSAELLRYLVHIRAGHEAVVPVGQDGSWQPLLALYHGRCAGRAEGLAASGERAAQALLAEVEVRPVTTEEVAKFGDPAELLARRP